MNKSKILRNTDTVPEIESDIFLSHPDSRFALGAFGSESVTNYRVNSELQSYLKLRSNVYVDQKKFLENDVKRLDGTECDCDDERSTHFIVFENKIGRVAVFGCMRLIEKTITQDSLLPVERFFPDTFEAPSPLGSLEVSRFITRHDSKRDRLITEQNIMLAALSHTLNNDLGPVYAVIEPSLERSLRMMKVPLERIADLRMLDEYSTENMAVRVDTDKWQKLLGKEAIERMNVPIGSYAFWGDMESDRIGNISEIG